MLRGTGNGESENEKLNMGNERFKLEIVNAKLTLKDCDHHCAALNMNEPTVFNRGYLWLVPEAPLLTFKEEPRFMVK